MIWLLVGAYEAYKTIDFLKKHNIPVILQVYIDHLIMTMMIMILSYKLATSISWKGSFSWPRYSGDMERMNTRNLPFYAGTCVAYGLDKEKAVQLITFKYCKNFRYWYIHGSLEVGKDATLFISEGDALDMRTNKLIMLLFKGDKLV